MGRARRGPRPCAKGSPQLCNAEAAAEVGSGRGKLRCAHRRFVLLIAHRDSNERIRGAALISGPQAGRARQYESQPDRRLAIRAGAR